MKKTLIALVPGLFCFLLGYAQADVKTIKLHADSTFLNEKGYAIASISCDIEYCEITCADKKVQDKINRSIFAHVNPFIFMDDSIPVKTAVFPNYKEMPQNFLINSRNEILSWGDISENEALQNWEWDGGASIMYNAHGLLCISFGEYTYLGGAHPNTYSTDVCYDLATGDTIGLNQIFLKGNETNLLQAITKHLDHEQMSDADSIFLTHNFYFNEKGITFYFNPYEIGCYAEGAFESTIPWSELKKYVDPKGPLSWVKK